MVDFMIVRRKAPFSLDALRAPLTAMGWDVTIHDALLGQREDARGVWLLKMEKSGRIYVRLTQLTGAPTGCILQKEGRAFALHSEQRLIKEVATAIDNDDDFAAALQIMEDLLLTSDVDVICRHKGPQAGDA